MSKLRLASASSMIGEAGREDAYVQNHVRSGSSGTVLPG